MNSTQARPIADPHNHSSESIPTAPVIEGVEKLENWLAHREIVVQELCPVGALETLYAQRAALYLWRLDRVTRSEIAAKIGEIEAGSEKKSEDTPEDRVNRILIDRSKLQTIIKYEAHLVRCLSSTMTELRRLQKERRQGLRDANPAGRGADRAGISQNESVETGSHGGSSSPKSSPSEKITDAETSIPSGRDADRAGICQNQEKQDGSHGDLTSQKSSPPQKNSPSLKSSPPQKNSHSRKNSARRNAPRSQRASPSPKIPPLLEAISARRRLCEFIAGETFGFERNRTTATLDFSIGRCP